MSRTSSRQGRNQDIRDVSKTLSAERREKLIALRDREAMKDVLLEKFQIRYGTQREKKDDDAVSVSESVIRNEVDTFVQKAYLTEENLARLERRIRQHSRKKNGKRGWRTQCYISVFTFFAPYWSISSSEVEPWLDCRRCSIRLGETGWIREIPAWAGHKETKSGCCRDAEETTKWFGSAGCWCAG